MTALAAPPLSAIAPPERTATFAWLRERGMGASILIAALSSAFGAILVVATAYIAAMLEADPYFHGRESVTIVIGILSALLLGIAVYVAAIVTANTFATIVAGRTRQIALFRLIGASARSQRVVIAKQGLIVGIIGAIAGVVLAIALCFPATAWITSTLKFQDLNFNVLQPALVLPAIFVVLTTWNAAWIGSRRVLTVTPLQALSSAEVRTTAEATSRARSIVSVILLVLGFGLVAGGVVLGLLMPFGVIVAFVGGLLSFTGMALGATWIMPPVLRLIGRTFGSSATARLAAENAMRNPERSSRMAIGVVMGVTLVSMFAVASESAKSVLLTSSDEAVDAALAQVLDSFSYIMMALVGVSAVIAAVGLVNLLTIGVVQRTRELGLLRALGFTKRQVRNMVLMEAAHISIASLIVGLILGVVYGWAGAQSTLGSVGVPPTYNAPTLVPPAIPWLFVVAVVVATAVLTIVASIAPTRLATRVAPVEAIAAD